MREAVIAIPRTLTGNYIAILAARRAVTLYFRMHVARRAIWEKTDHDMPIEQAAFERG